MPAVIFFAGLGLEQKFSLIDGHGLKCYVVVLAAKNYRHVFSIYINCHFFLIKTPLFPPDFSIRHMSDMIIFRS